MLVGHCGKIEQTHAKFRGDREIALFDKAFQRAGQWLIIYQVKAEFIFPTWRENTVLLED